MFGMLDYRAHKLYWLLGLPIRLAARIAFFIAVVASVLIAERTSYSGLVKVGIAMVAFEVISGVLLWCVWMPTTWMLRRTFFWLVDVIPARGANAEEARVVVLTGPTFTLTKKLEDEVQNWTAADTRALAARMNWRSRLLFDAGGRIKRLARELTRIYEETGNQPRDLDRETINAITERTLHRTTPKWVESAIVSQAYFNSIVAFILIVAAVAYISANST